MITGSEVFPWYQLWRGRHQDGVTSREDSQLSCVPAHAGVARLSGISPSPVFPVVPSGGTSSSPWYHVSRPQEQRSVSGLLYTHDISELESESRDHERFVLRDLLITGMKHDTTVGNTGKGKGCRGMVGRSGESTDVKKFCGKLLPGHEVIAAQLEAGCKARTSWDP